MWVSGIWTISSSVRCPANVGLRLNVWMGALRPPTAQPWRRRGKGAVQLEVDWVERMEAWSWRQGSEPRRRVGADEDERCGGSRAYGKNRAVMAASRRADEDCSSPPFHHSGHQPELRDDRRSGNSFRHGRVNLPAALDILDALTRVLCQIPPTIDGGSRLLQPNRKTIGKTTYYGEKLTVVRSSWS